MNYNYWYPPHPQQQGYGSLNHNRNWYPGPSFTPQQQQPNYLPNWDRNVSIVDAIYIALEQVPGEVVSAELEHEQGIMVYEVEIVTQQGVKYEIDVDVNSGEVISVGLD